MNIETAQTPPISTTALAKLSGISYRMLDYWCRQRVIVPSIAAAGSGSARAWSTDETSVVIAISRVNTDFNTMGMKMPLALVRELWNQLSRDGYAIVALPTLTIEVGVEKGNPDD